MNILYVIAKYGADYSGNLIHQELGHAFQQRGHPFEVLAFASARELQGQFTPSVEENIRVYRAPAAGTFQTDAINTLTKPLLHYDRFAAAWWEVRHFFAARPSYDVILVESAYPFGALCALAAPHQMRLIVTAAGGDFIDSYETQYGYGRFRTARRLMRYAFQRASAVRVTTPLVRDRVLALGARPEQITLIPRNIASYCFPPPDTLLPAWRQASCQEFTRRYGIHHAHILLGVGRLLPIKGFDTLVRALPTIESIAGDTHLLLIGPNRADTPYGDYQNYLANLAAECGVRDKITFTGAIPHHDMRTLLAAADLVAVPSVLEGMNKIAVEAAAVGTPAVVTRTSGIADLMEKAEVGAIVEPNDARALAATIGALLNHPARRAELGERGAVWAHQFSSPVIAAQLIELCKRVST
ncbi:MAG TPA: glycosyltransferase family 4 protein [Anaerolineae bacterium]|nr:glycosyltransferase family 4 protein [Anaerolineae bacterium]